MFAYMKYTVLRKEEVARGFWHKYQSPMYQGTIAGFPYVVVFDFIEG